VIDLVSKDFVLPLVAGIGVGGIAGYAVATKDYGAIRPRIELSSWSVLIGNTYNMTLVNFPPNKQLVSARNTSVAGGDLVNIGTTDGNGRLTLVNLTAVGPAGNYYFVIWDAETGQYCAMAMLNVQ
jgi:hypothetical protein